MIGLPIFKAHETSPKAIVEISESPDGEPIDGEWYLDELKTILNSKLPAAIRRSLPDGDFCGDYKIVLIKKLREVRESGPATFVRIDVVLPDRTRQNSYYFKLEEPKPEGEEEMEGILNEIIGRCHSCGLDCVPLSILEKAADGDEVGAMDDIDYRAKMFNIVHSMIEHKKYELAKMIIGELRLHFGKDDSNVNMLDFIVNFFNKMEPFGCFDDEVENE